MGKVLFSILITLEVALMIYSLATEARQERIRSIARIAALISFCVLVVVSVIHWSFRWFGLAFLLTVWALLAIRSLLKPRRETKAYSAFDIVIRAFVALILICLAILPALVFPQYELPDATGPYSVGEDRHTYIDEARIEIYSDSGEARKINIAFWYPEDAPGVHPLVIFSHGSLGIDTSNVYLYRELASRGYVVASLGHPYHSFWTKGADGKIAFLNIDYAGELQREDPRIDKQQSYSLYQKWMDIRMGDIEFAIETILEQAADGTSGVYSLVDVEKIGVMGHSLGGSAALGIGRQRDDIDAVVALESPLMFDIIGVENDEFVLNPDIYPTPVLNIYSDSSWDHLSEWTQYAANLALLSDSGATAFNVHIKGLSHLALTDLVLTSPFLVRSLDSTEATRDSLEGLRTINEVTIEFFDAYLKSQGEFTSDGVH